MILEDTQDSGAASAGSTITEIDKAKLYVDVWKQTVEVQKHFNDLEWRIRGLALTAATFALGASAVAARDRTTLGGISLGAVVLLAGLLLWHAFYFADRYWYHPLLLASVRHGEQLEEELRSVLPKIGLALDISAGSPSKPPLLWCWRKKDLHSSEKLLYFYIIGGVVLVMAAALLQLSTWASPAPPSKNGLDSPSISSFETPTSEPPSPQSASPVTAPSVQREPLKTPTPTRDVRGTQATP